MRFLKALCALAFLTLAIATPALGQSAYDGVAQRPSASPLIYGIFDLPDGTTITGNVLESGNSAWTNLGAGNFMAVDGESTNGNAGCSPAPGCSNTYNDFPNSATLGGTPQPITSQGGSFRFNNDQMALALIADAGTGGSSFVNFLHLNFGPHGWALTYCVTGTCPSGFTVLGTGSYSLIIGQPYGISWDLDQPNHRVRLHLPDGTNTGWYTFSSSMPALVYNRFQIGGFSSPLSARWLNVWSGQSKAEALVAAGRGAPMAEITRLNGLQNKVAASKSVTYSGSPVYTPFASFDSGNPQSGNRLTVHVSAVLVSSALPGTAMDIEDWEVPVYSSACCQYLGSTVGLHSNPVAMAGIYLTGALNVALSGTVVTLGYVGSISGPNSAYANGWRLNYSVTAEGDGGTLTPQ
jgi:hypothetical protein